MMLLPACWYDSTWGQSKRAQQHLAAAVTPGPIAAADDEGHGGRPRRVYKIRLRPSARYLSQTVDAERQLEQLVEDANGVLDAGLGLQLEVEATKPWALDSDEHLEAALAALNKEDDGSGVDVVVGLIGALPRPTESLHELGMAEVLGKHLVVRAASRLGEHDAVDRAMPSLDDDERDRVVRARRRHRAEAVFLHELGHVLGALHEADKTSLMHPAYDEHMNAFGSDAVILMRLALDEPDRGAALRGQLDYLRNARTTAWIASERDAEIARLQEMTAPAHAPVTAPAPTPGGAAPDEEGPADLPRDDRARFNLALRQFKAGNVAGAYDAARPLFTAYPAVYAVQDLRCQLATVRWMEKEAMLKECAGAVRLADAGAPRAP
jgi:hypothetical protein